MVVMIVFCIYIHIGNARLRSTLFGFDLLENYTVVPPFDRLVFRIAKRLL